MSQRIAEVIVDILSSSLDRPFDYLIPDEISDVIREGSPVVIPFGRADKEITGYVIKIKDTTEYDITRLKSIADIHHGEVPVEGQLLSLAAWIKEHYGSTMSEAIKTVLPVRSRIKSVEEHWLNLIISPDEAYDLADEEEKKHHTARARLLRALAASAPITLSAARKKYKTTGQVIDALCAVGAISVTDVCMERRPEELSSDTRDEISYIPNEEQKNAIDTITRDIDAGDMNTYLLYGVTGSGKTFVYIEIIKKVIQNGCQAIVLIPEIALTHQTLARFRAAFPDRITILHSRMSAGERYDQFMRIYRHEVDIVIGPRSALFVPFDRLGLIVMDEEHENSYQSEKNPTYHARDVAAERARRAGASLILGSATPSVKSYYQAMNGKYRLIRLSHRASGADRPSVYVVDLRDELKAKNRSIFSRLLHEKIRDRLDRHEQIMLFINRRGYAGFVSCRSCGYVIKCSHCDVSMTEHGRQSRNPRLICHYCGDTAPMPSVCPSCGSPYIASFGMGTEKVCELAKKEFPDARIIRMDADTTRNKDGHERILSVFREHGADILVGTQMIAKGHDIGNVTLVGAIAADMSLYQDDYRSFERTYQLLEQAGGRSGRSSKPGEFIIQTYNPDSYCIEAVASDRPDFFYESELSFRRLAGYPPYRELMKIRISSEDEKKASEAGVMIDKWIRGSARDEIVTIGPAPEKISFVGDRFRYSLFVKTENANTMDGVISMVTENINNTGMNRNVSVIFERT